MHECQLNRRESSYKLLRISDFFFAKYQNKLKSIKIIVNYAFSTHPASHSGAADLEKVHVLLQVSIYPYLSTHS